VSTQYFNVPDAEGGQAVVVKWDGSAGGTLWNPSNHFRVTLSVDYSIDGGAWTPIDQYVYELPAPGGGNPAAFGAVERSASVSAPTGQVQFRATNSVEVLNCAAGFNIGSITGTMHVWDIRVTAPLPPLEASPSNPTRGDTVTFSFDAPSNTVFTWWKYVTDENGTVTRQTNVSSSTWSGTMVADGAAQLSVSIGSETFDLSNDLAVTPRDSAWSPVNPNQVPNGTFATLPSPPIPNGALGMMEIGQPYTYYTAIVADDGPNAGLKWLTAVQNNATFRYELSPDLESDVSSFYVAQCGNYSQQNTNGFIDGSQLLTNTQQHEAGPSLGHYEQYVTAQNDPGNNVGVGAEPLIAGPAVSLESFKTVVLSELDARASTIVSQTTSEAACNSDVRYDTACVFGGYINFSPYQPCF